MDGRIVYNDPSGALCRFAIHGRPIVIHLTPQDSALSRRQCLTEAESGQPMHTALIATDTPQRKNSAPAQVETATSKHRPLEDFRATVTRRWRCSITLRCSIISGSAIRHSARSVRPHSSGVQRRRAWTLPSPWTPRTRPQGFGKPQRTRFPTAPTPIVIVLE